MTEYRHPFSPEAWQQLAAFGLKDCTARSPLSLDAVGLTEDATCMQILQAIMPALGAPNLKVTASLVLKRFAFLTLAPLLYAMSRLNQGLDVSLNNCVFEYPLENRIWRSGLPLKNVRFSLVSEEREPWRETLLRQAFQGNLSQLVSQLHRLTRTPEKVLWENVAVRVFSIYERRIMIGMPDEITAQVQADYRFLLNPQTTDIFGLKVNPLSGFHHRKIKAPGCDEPVRVRRTCCYYYRATEPARYCSNCPLLFRQPHDSGDC
ncbi:IucA/IucC family C-terminal-domain containing protein [Vibrio quintilis]|uniref:Ferric iron reductase FhuF-like transporter n=1 Tax=Vibrio quintilis TaxID=1117707 RepID=A0A1M7Z2Z4_9VIBR|nr:IucA/IucC family C-terminal-domain containing protein [Vibrio quintilis]SHO59263.1 Ferric iron reductase FhuF-like transporter [Vibrio quintilis]